MGLVESVSVSSVVLSELVAESPGCVPESASVASLGKPEGKSAEIQGVPSAEMEGLSTFYVTTPIYYVNDAPHIGHAYTSILADCLARWARVRAPSGDTHTRFLTGTDEHGQKVAQAAAAQGLTPQAMVDRNVKHFEGLKDLLQLSTDDFIRTTQTRHQLGAQALFQKLVAAGDVYEGVYEGWYHTADERFLTEAEYEALKDGPDAKFIERAAEKNLFFRLSRYVPTLIRFYESAVGKNHIQPESRRQEVLGVLRRGFHDLSVSRTTFDWGIPVPGHPGHVMYVWLDALSNYVTALADPQQPGFAEGPLFHRFWGGAAGKHTLHALGKDILVFHAVYWPAFLVSALLGGRVDASEDELARWLPKLLVHGWWTVNGGKMSKRYGNVVVPREIVDRYGADAFRWFLLREMTVGEDGDFSEPALVLRTNAELVNKIGNLFHRTANLVKQHLGNRIPVPPPLFQTLNEDLAASEVPHESALRQEYRLAMDALDLRTAGDALIRYAEAFNAYVDQRQPWALAKDPERRGELSTVLYNLLSACGHLAQMLYPYCPAKADELLSRLGFRSEELSTARLWTSSWVHLPNDGRELPDIPGHLFARIPETELKAAEARRAEILARMNGSTAPSASPAASAVTTAPRPQGKSVNASDVSTMPTGQGTTSVSADSAAPPPPDSAVQAPPIDYADFAKLDLRCARVLTAERVPKADKLLKLTLDVGSLGTRTVAAGIAASYPDPTALVGRTVVLLANLKPRKIRGIESQGMLLVAGPDEGPMSLVGPREVGGESGPGCPGDPVK